MAWHPALPYDCSHPLYGKMRFKGVATLITGGGGSAKRQAAAATAKQVEAQKAQDAIQARAQIREDERAAELSGQMASQRRAVITRRQGRGGLAYTGLKPTLGG